MVQPFLAFFINVYLSPFLKSDADGVYDKHRPLKKRNGWKKVLTRENTFDIINSVKLNYYVNQRQNNGY